MAQSEIRKLDDEELVRTLRLAKLDCKYATERDTIRRQNEAQKWHDKLEREIRRRADISGDRAAKRR